MTVITLGELLDAGVHFGHQASRWNPKMFPYIYAEQNGIHVIDLVQTARLLTYAYEYVHKASQEKKTFLFVLPMTNFAAERQSIFSKIGHHHPTLPLTNRTSK